MNKVTKKQLLIIIPIFILLLLVLFFILDYNINGSPADKKAAKEARERLNETNKQYNEFLIKQQKYD